jgi:hypothetical protein
MTFALPPDAEPVPSRDLADRAGPEKPQPKLEPKSGTGL